MNTEHEFLVRLARLLDEAGIPYMATGSTSSSIHGRPRATQDADIVIDPGEDQLEAFIVLLGQDYYISRDAAFDALNRRAMFNIIDLARGRKADLIIRKDRPFSRQEFSRRRQVDVKGHVLSVAAPEDIILSKLEWMKGRESDVQYCDALGVAVAQWGNLDLEYLRTWAGQLGVEGKLECLLKEAEEQVERMD